jgi:iron complex outermembrane receptor protein
MFLWAAGDRLAAQQDTSSIFKMSLAELLNLSVEVSTASKSASSSEEAPAAVFVITREDIERLGLATLGEALNYVPGFTVGRSIQTGQQKSIYVRGEVSSLSEGVLILYDGQRLNDGITGGALALTSDYALDNIKQIEVIRGPVSALYGANAFVAVVNLIPYRPQEIHRSLVSAQAGNRDWLAVRGHHAWSLGAHVRAAVHGSFQRLDDPVRQRTVQQQIFDTTAGTFVPREFPGRVNLEKNDLLSLSASLSWKGMDLDAQFSKAEGRDYWGLGTPVKEDSLQNSHANANLRLGTRYVTGFGRNNRLTVLGSYAIHRAENAYKVENFRSVLYPGFDPPGSASIFEADLKTSTFNAESYIEWNFSRVHRTVAGVNVQADLIDAVDNSTAILDTDGDGIFDSVAADDTLDTILKRQTRSVFAFFAQHTWTPWPRLSVTGGARWDRYSDFGRSLNPRLTVVLKPADRWILKGMYGRAFRAPSFFETHQSDFSSAGNRLVQNPDLEPETIETFEVQLTFKPKESLVCWANAYYNDVQDVIRPVEFEQSGVPTQSKWQNAGSRDWSGVELGVRYVPRRFFSLFANYSYTKTDDEKIEDVEEPVSGLPGHAFNFGISVSRGRATLNINGFSRFGWNDVPADTSPHMILDRMELPDYLILNARLTVENVWKSVALFVDVRNVLDRRSYFNDDRIYVPQGISGNNRRLAAGLTYSF